MRRPCACRRRTCRCPTRRTSRSCRCPTPRTSSRRRRRFVIGTSNDPHRQLSLRSGEGGVRDIEGAGGAGRARVPVRLLSAAWCGEHVGPEGTVHGGGRGG